MAAEALKMVRKASQVTCSAVAKFQLCDVTNTTTNIHKTYFEFFIFAVKKTVFLRVLHDSTLGGTPDVKKVCDVTSTIRNYK